MSRSNMTESTLLIGWSKIKRIAYDKLIAYIGILGICGAMIPVSAIELPPNVSFARAAAVVDQIKGSAQEEQNYPVIADKQPKKTITVVSTAYNSLAGQTDSTPCIPAMPKFDLCAFYEEHGYGNSIAANFLPLGTQVRFPDMYGDKIFVVRDRMNARYGYGRIDIWMNEHKDAKAFGVKKLKMEIF